MGPDKMTSLCSQILELLTASKRILQNISCCEISFICVVWGEISPGRLADIYNSFLVKQCKTVRNCKEITEKRQRIVLMEKVFL